MSDATLNTENETVTQTDEKVVEIPQSKIDALINESFGKGAKKANAELLSELGVDSTDDLKERLSKVKEMEDASKSESDKLRESIESVKADNERLSAENRKLSFDNQVSTVAIEAGVTERELFSHLYASASNQENFEVNGFIAGLKLDKPFLFGNQTPVKPKVDSSRTDPDAVPQNEKAAKARAAFA